MSMGDDAYPLTENEERIYKEIVKLGNKPFTIDDIIRLNYKKEAREGSDVQRKNVLRIMRNISIKTFVNPAYKRHVRRITGRRIGAIYVCEKKENVNETSRDHRSSRRQDERTA